MPPEYTVGVIGLIMLFVRATTYLVILVVDGEEAYKGYDVVQYCVGVVEGAVPQQVAGDVPYLQADAFAAKHALHTHGAGYRWGRYGLVTGRRGW